MHFKNWPKEERPREKLLTKGASSLSDSELLAIFIRTGVNGKSALDLGRELLVQFGDLRHILNAKQEDICKVSGFGITKFVQLQAVLELNKRYLACELQRSECLNNPDLTKQYLLAQLRDENIEKFSALLLDNRHRVIKYVTFATGTLNQATVHPREVIKTVLAANAAAVIFAHNHPSGISEPSTADIRLTKRLQEGLALLNIRVLDHFVIGDGDCTSFAEMGLI